MMKALLLNAEAKTASVQTIPIPKLHPNPPHNERQLLIRIEAVALNPVDSLYIHNPIASTGRTVGSDFAGVVVDISPPLTTTGNHEGDSSLEKIQVGDRVAGLVQGSNSKNPRPGAFAEYLLLEDADAELIWKVPEWMTLEQAAAVSLCGLTAAQGVYYRLGIPAPFSWVGGPSSPTCGMEEDDTDTITVLIYGATTSLGLYAAQLVKLGFSFPRNKTGSKNPRLNLIGLASPSKFSMLRSAPYNYTHLIDYHSPSWVSQVRDLTSPGGVDLALDCICEGSTVSSVLSTLAKNQHSKLAIFRSKQSGAWNLPTEEGMADVNKAIYGAVWEGLGHDILYGNGMTIKATEESREFTKGFYHWLSSSSSSSSSEVGVLEPNPIRLMPGGLERIVPDGFALLGGGRMGDRGDKREEEWMRPVSGEKLVYKIRE